ncbi:MAG: bifunctional 3,4-dihydroxy-2-butanone-4-phosphate synthase/GTP cyclohydrolase II [Candidatus Riflebacteria bacterium]|nr:bifunctional 3,4-dihydroxy-2-butanone-4-phosphate synthase/GTP cyclohydrolase II [Candidatus Riflebacteria bacterium]
MFTSMEEAKKNLVEGKIVIVCDDDDRENEGDFTILAQHATSESINFMITHGRGLVCAPISENIAQRLNLSPMVRENTDPHGTAFTVSIDHKLSSTGISAAERAFTLRALSDPQSKPDDFRRPGHIFPLIGRKGGVLRRAGHTEAAIDLARLAAGQEAGVICEIMREDGSMARLPDLQGLAERFDLQIVSIRDLIAWRFARDTLATREVETSLPTRFGEFVVVGYSNVVDDLEHLALVKGKVDDGEPVLTRVHSACATGDVFGSRRCDCGEQLEAALRKINEEGRGALIYLQQEGRGIGLLNKLRAYKLQENGLDTVEANAKLGFRPDLRDYGIGAQILRDLGITRMKLMTNNPRKIKGLSGYGLEIVERVPLEMVANSENQGYLQTKCSKLGHMLKMP